MDLSVDGVVIFARRVGISVVFLFVRLSTRSSIVSSAVILLLIFELLGRKLPSYKSLRQGSNSAKDCFVLFWVSTLSIVHWANVTAIAFGFAGGPCGCLRSGTVALSKVPLPCLCTITSNSDRPGPVLSYRVLFLSSKNRTCRYLVTSQARLFARLRSELGLFDSENGVDISASRLVELRLPREMLLGLL